MVPCSKCRQEAVIFQPYSGQHLCRDHFILDFETKAKREIRRNHWMGPGDHIAVLLTGAGAEHALLSFFRRLAGARSDIRITGIPAGTAADLTPVIRDMKVTKIASPVSLEEVSARVLVSFLKGRIPTTGIPDPGCHGTVPCITPFSHIPAEEVRAYARFLGAWEETILPSHTSDSLYGDVTALMADYTARHPAAPHAVLNLYEALSGNLPGEIQRASPHKRGPGSPGTRVPNS